MPDLPDIRQDHKNALGNANGFEWIGGCRRPSTMYTGAYHRLGFRLYMDGKQGGRKEEFRVGTCVTVNVHSKQGSGTGEAHAPSIAVIIGILEDRWGSCHVALHYFWRWGQIHAGADLHPATALCYKAHIFLQKEWTEKSGNAVKYPDGSFRDVVPALQINHTVVVLTRQQVVRHYGQTGRAPLDAFEAAFCRSEHLHAGSGCRDNGFWYTMTFDHSCYKFESVCGGEVPTLNMDADPYFEEDTGPQSVVDTEAAATTAATSLGAAQAAAAATTSRNGQAHASVRRLQIARGLTMGDVFCGLGTVSIAANTVGFQVEFGIDSGRGAISSFISNTTGHFNPITRRTPLPVKCKLEDVVSQLRQERAAETQLTLAQVDYLHFSPPCQNVSMKKPLERRTFSGAEVKSALELVEILRPPFVTLEEVLGFLMQRFLPHNLLGDLMGYPNPPPSQADQQGSAAADEQAAADDSDAEGEGSADVEELEGSDNESSAAADETQAGKMSVSGGVLLNPVLLVVSKLLDMSYQVRLALLNAADYGAPQKRWRMFLFAAQESFQLPVPPPRRYVAPASAPGLESRPRLPAKDTGFITRDGDHGDWVEVLCMPEPDSALCPPPYISLQEAWGDLPPLLTDTSHTYLKRPAAGAPGTNGSRETAATGGQQAQHGGTQCNAKRQQQQQQQQQSKLQQKRHHRSTYWLGTHVMPYDPAAGVMGCPLPVDGAAPVSRYSRYLRSPRTPHQDGGMSTHCLLRDHTSTYPPHEVRDLLLVADRKQEADSEEKAAWKDRKGRRPTADGVAVCVLGHNEPKRFCLHFKEPRYVTLAERRRAQSLPDTVCIEGDQRDKEQQVGNAVPYLLAAEVAASVWEAATGQQACRPPLLNGPCQEGTGITDQLAKAHYSIWLQQQLKQHNGWQGVVQASRKCLEQATKDILAQHKQERLDLLRQQQQVTCNANNTSAELLQQ